MNATIINQTLNQTGVISPTTSPNILYILAGIGLLAVGIAIGYFIAKNKYDKEIEAKNEDLYADTETEDENEIKVE